MRPRSAGLTDITAANKIARKRAVLVPKDAAHLKQHRFTVDGDEPLGKDPICARLYEADDKAVRAMADRGAYIRELVRQDLRG